MRGLPPRDIARGGWQQRKADPSLWFGVTTDVSALALASVGKRSSHSPVGWPTGPTYGRMRGAATHRGPNNEVTTKRRYPSLCFGPESVVVAIASRRVSAEVEKTHRNIREQREDFLVRQGLPRHAKIKTHDPSLRFDMVSLSPRLRWEIRLTKLSFPSMSATRGTTYEQMRGPQLRAMVSSGAQGRKRTTPRYRSAVILLPAHLCAQLRTMAQQSHTTVCWLFEARHTEK